ncbi:hypothetical protein FSP39_009006 [Pinctada imbricata]|uniref:B box-type domain-containing protein n=1 Tax=Pinctada imbricata TaxID=66713 RepID=A0AA88XEX8_PINIB|nr:hypothetical protein FSP39_009006 [Pinctada imbricata]
MMAMSKSVNLAHAQRAVPCDACEDDAPGEYYCVECKQTLCPQCEKFHRKFTKGHNVVLRTQIGDIDTTTLTCTDHDDAATYHCEKCNVPVCGRCVTGKHQCHKLVDLTTILERERNKLQDGVIRIKRDILPKLKKRQEKITIEKEIYEKKIQRITKDMEDEKKEIDRIHNERMKKIASIRESQLSTFNYYLEDTDKDIRKVQKTMAEYEEVIRKSSLATIINLLKRKDPPPETGCKVDLPNAPVYVPGDLQSVLGKLQVSSPPPSVSKPLKLTTPTVVSKFKCPLEGYPQICITKEGDVWLGGSESRELVMVDIKGQVLRRRNIQNRPYSLAVMDCGDVIIIPHGGDSRSVNRLMKDDREQHVFDPSTPCSNGVSVTADQKILICIYDGRVVSINGDGTNVKHIYKCSGIESAIHAVENADGNIYISGWTNHAVVKVNKDGKVLSTITHTTGGQQLGGPWGLVVDKMDNILCADSDKHCVYIIDQNQQMRKLVGHSHGIQRPSWLAVDNDNNLWITQEYGNVHVVKYLSPCT